MRFQKLLLCLVGLLALGSLRAQDIHYSLFNMAPLTLNAANTGAFFGTARVGGIYRNQGFAVDDFNGYATPSFYVDAPIIQGFRKNDWVGVGFVVVSDRVDMQRLVTTQAALSAAYHLGLDRAGKSVLSIGFQGGTTGRRVDLDRLTPSDVFDTSLGGLGSNASIDNLLTGGAVNENTNRREKMTDYLDFSTGIMLRTALSDKSSLEAGVAFRHISTPAESFGGASVAERPWLTAVHARFDMMLTEKLSIAPTALFQTIAKQQEIALQGWAGYQINPDVKLNGGLGYRFSDAGQVLVGVDYKDLRAALAYDVTFSDLNSVNNYQGGLEFGVWYVIKIFKKPVVKPALLCPRF